MAAGMALLVITVAVAGCFGEQVQRPCPVASSPGSPPTIGVLAPLSGPLSEIGGDTQAAVELAVLDLNQAGGITGRDVTLMVEDTASSPAQAAAAAKALVDQGAQVVVGPVTNAATLAAMNITTQAGVPLITHGATSDLVTTRDTADLVYRMVPPDSLQGQALGQLLVGASAGSVAVVHAQTQYGQAVSRSLTERLAAGTPVSLATTVSLAPGGNASQAIQEAVEPDPDAIAYIGFPDPGQDLLKAAHEHGALDGRGLFLTEGMLSHPLIQALRQETGDPALLTGAQGTAPTSFLTGQSADRFETAFQENHARAPGLFAAEAYDAAIVAGLAMAAAQSTLPSALAACLQAVWDPPGQALGSDRLTNALNLATVGRSLDYAPVSPAGPWNQTGDPSVASYAFWQVTGNGTIEVVETDIKVRT